MNYSKSLTPYEQEETNKLFSDNHVNQATRQLCIKLYSQYKSFVTLTNDRIPVAIRCAFFIAEKNQILYDLKGQRINGVGLSLNQFLKNGQIDIFMLVLKDFIRKVKIEDREVIGQLQHTYKKISFIMVFHDRFKKSMQKLQYPASQDDYLIQITTYAWLFFIMTRKQKQFSQDSIENTFLLASILSFFVIYAWEYSRPRAFADYRNQDKKSISVDVQHCILSTFNIKKQSSDSYSSIYSVFNNFFVDLVNKKVIRMSNGKQDFLSPKYIDTNMKKLDHLYQSKLLHDDLDERLLLKQRSINLTPSRFTPLSKQGYLNKLGQGKNNEQAKLGCHRELEYDNFDRADITLPIGKQIKEAKIPDHVLKSPVLSKPQQLFHSPVTEDMRMFNYLNQKSKKYKQNSSQNSSTDSMIQGLIIKVIQYTNKKNQTSKQLAYQLIFSLFKITISQYSQQYPEEVMNEQLLKGFLAICIQLVFFVKRTTLQFEQIQRIVESNPVQEWKACDFFMKPDPSIPAKLRLHILNLQVNLISQKIFLSQSFISTLQKIINNQNSTKVGHIQRCIKRTVHHLAYQTSQLCQSLNIQDSVAQQIFQILKICVSKFTSMIYRRHLDQIVFCSIFCCCKKRGIPIKFQDIKEKYQQINPKSQQQQDIFIAQVYMQNEQPTTIIKFYNSIFIPNLEQYLCNPLSQNDFKHKKPSKNPSTVNQVLQSPLRFIIPSQMKCKIKSNNNNNNKISQAPFGQKLLYAINESPITRFQATFKSKTSNLSKRYIDFNDNNLIKPQQPNTTNTSNQIINPMNLNNINNLPNHHNLNNIQNINTGGQVEGLEEMNSFFQKFNKSTPTISKQTSQKTLFYGENSKPNFQKILFERR